MNISPKAGMALASEKKERKQVLGKKVAASSKPKTSRLIENPTMVVVKKTVKKRNAKSDDPNRSTTFSPLQRMQMIAETAYFRAQRRGFDGEKQLQDWLEAEREIDSKHFC